MNGPFCGSVLAASRTAASPKRPFIAPAERLWCSTSHDLHEGHGYIHDQHRKLVRCLTCMKKVAKYKFSAQQFSALSAVDTSLTTTHPTSIMNVTAVLQSFAEPAHVFLEPRHEYRLQTVRGWIRQGNYRIRRTGTLQLRTISVVVDPITRLRIRLWP